MRMEGFNAGGGVEKKVEAVKAEKRVRPQKRDEFNPSDVLEQYRAEDRALTPDDEVMESRRDAIFGTSQSPEDLLLAQEEEGQNVFLKRGAKEVESEVGVAELHEDEAVHDMADAAQDEEYGNTEYSAVVKEEPEPIQNPPMPAQAGQGEPAFVGRPDRDVNPIENKRVGSGYRSFGWRGNKPKGTGRRKFFGSWW